jgi:hypothetical protein
MKSLPLALVFTISALHAADTPLPEFNSSAIGHPPLSLSESAKLKTKPSTFASTLPTLDDVRSGGLLGANPRPALARITPPQPRFAPKSGLWNMPILQPNPQIDHRIVLKEPDPRIDFKMLIKPGATEPQPAK